jgi:two-component system cell cycle sensor histidine kinase/response regulator CckA
LSAVPIGLTTEAGGSGNSSAGTQALRVLLAEDSDMDAQLIVHALSRGSRELRLERVEDPRAMEEALDRGGWDAVISDWSMPSFTAPEALAIVRRKQPDLPFIIVSGTIGEEIAVDAMRAGANDYLLKDRLARLLPVLEREIRDAQVRQARRQAEEALRASEEALRQSQEQFFQAQKMDAVGRLAGGVAHDFNNVLSVVMTYADLLLLDLGPDMPMRSDLEEIRKAAERAAGLTRQLLIFSRQQMLEPKVLNLNELVAGMAKMLERVAGEGLVLTLLPASDLGSVRADPGQMEQALMNLVANARDAMPNGGQLTIRTANVDIDEAQAREHRGVKAGAYAEISVSDTGTGMDAVTKAHIFEPFFTTKPQGKGTGLGLATVFGIAQQSKGHVRVESALGEGSTFRIVLPLTDEPVSTAAGAEPSIASLIGSETILLVEDDHQVLVVVHNILRRFGYQVLQAHNAGEALLIGEKHPGQIHLLLTDVVMPYVSGPELAKRLAALRADVKVLCMSGYTDDSFVPRDFFDSGLAFLQKPITPERLGRKIREVLQSDLRR